MANGWLSRITGNAIVQLWTYRSTFIISFFFFVGFCAVIPIDAISQASQSSNNYALNTFVVVGALVLFGITASIIASTRVYIQRSALQDIPKRYVPLDTGDMSKNSLRMIDKNFDKCEGIRTMALKAPDDVSHPGLSAPNSSLLPPLLNFDDVVRAIGMKFKWDLAIVGNYVPVPKNMSFREVIADLETRMMARDSSLNRDYVELYEKLRYSGELISQEEFIIFMEYSIEFIKSITSNFDDNTPARSRYSASERSTEGTSMGHSLRNRHSNFHSQQPSTSYLPPMSTEKYSDEFNEDPETNGDQVYDFYQNILRTHTNTSGRTTGTTNYRPY